MDPVEEIFTHVPGGGAHDDDAPPKDENLDDKDIIDKDGLAFSTQPWADVSETDIYDNLSHCPSSDRGDITDSPKTESGARPADLLCDELPDSLEDKNQASGSIQAVLDLESPQPLSQVFLQQQRHSDSEEEEGDNNDNAATVRRTRMRRATATTATTIRQQQQGQGGGGQRQQ